jgi:hypothetical protein
MGEQTMTTTAEKGYRSTESKYKGGAHEMYVTYDLTEQTRAQNAVYPKVKRLYVSGSVTDWKTGIVRNKLGRDVHGVRIEYEQTRKGYRRKGYAAHRGETEYCAEAANVAAAAQRLPKSWSSQRLPATCIFTLTTPNCRQGTGRHCSASASLRP